jgi:hypothetical protein
MLAFFSISICQGQFYRFDFNSFYNGGQSNDIGLQLSRIDRIQWISNRTTFNSCLDIRSIDWGNQISFGFGPNLGVNLGKKEMEIRSALFVGRALFRDNSMMTYGLAIEPVLYKLSLPFFKMNPLHLGIKTGVRMNWCPAYEPYGNNFQLEIPLTIFIGRTYIHICEKPPRPEQDPRLLGD